MKTATKYITWLKGRDKDQLLTEFEMVLADILRVANGEKDSVEIPFDAPDLNVKTFARSIGEPGGSPHYKWNPDGSIKRDENGKPMVVA